MVSLCTKPVITINLLFLLASGLTVKQSFEDLEWEYFSITDEETTYLNSWAVQINAGSVDVANALADKYGFINRGKVSILLIVVQKLLLFHSHIDWKLG